MGIFLLLLASGLCRVDAGGGPGGIVVYPAEGTFDEVIDNVKMAIEERGLLVSGILHASDMLNRTGKDLGFPPVFKRAESVEFCSALVAHKMTQTAPQNMAVCPFTISVYVRADQPGHTYVAYQQPWLAGDAQAARAAIQEMLDGIAREAIEE